MNCKVQFIKNIFPEPALFEWESIEYLPPIDVILEIKDSNGNIFKARPIINYIEKSPLIRLSPVFTGFWRIYGDNSNIGEVVAWRFIQNA